METPRALIAGARRLLFAVFPRSDGSTSIHAPHMRESDATGKMDKWESSLAGMKFWAHNDTISQSGQLNGRPTVGVGLVLDATWSPLPSAPAV
ncbi:hypothetical protein FOMA001_g19989 [Fusarium oxysporum f. sp. matthiolae]|nr:hypothetical protein FOMA001_g19989 [Fusarium oxysporum f. sp. matthiolae]